jgi:IMP cyclohydrolase
MGEGIEMKKNLENVEEMVYPGRIIIIGKSPAGEDVVMYAITGRSPSSQARMLLIDEVEKKIFVKPTDEETLKTGNPDLLVYPAIICGSGIAVSNGKQTEDVLKCLDADKDPLQVQIDSLVNWEYEPDDPNFTPRISGCITSGAALSVLKRAEDGFVIRNYFKIPMILGKGKLISTYTGVNQNPLPSFAGEPQDVEIPWTSAEEAVTAFYHALGPDDGEPDFRVTAAVVYSDPSGKLTMKVKNRNA